MLVLRSHVPVGSALAQASCAQIPSTAPDSLTSSQAAADLPGSPACFASLSFGASVGGDASHAILAFVSVLPHVSPALPRSEWSAFVQYLTHRDSLVG